MPFYRRIEGVKGSPVGKGARSLDESELSRSKLIALFGGEENLPSSIMRRKAFAKVDLNMDGAMGNGRRYDDTSQLMKLSREKKRTAKGALKKA